MQTDEQLPPDLTWETDGHLTEVALMMLADGEAALIDGRAPSHVEGCEACSARLGAAALMALRVGEELPAIAARASLEAAATEVVRRVDEAPLHAAVSSAPLVIASGTGMRGLPLRAITAALLIAAVGSVPSFMAGADELPELLMTLIRGLVMIGRTVAGVAQGSARDALLVAPALSWLSAGLLVLSGLAVARVMSRRRVLQEGGM